MANRIPRIKRFDSTRALLRDPYGFIGQHCRRERTDVFEARILLRRVLCMSGPEAAALIYDRERFKRHGATPEPVRATLFGKRGVQGLDDEAHRRRKGMFMSIMTPGRVRELAELAVGQWEAAARQWAIDDRVVLYDELHVLLTRAVCAWAGLPLCEPELRQRAGDLAALFDSAGALPWGHLRARRARSRAERWISERVRSIRRAPRGPGIESPAGMIASHKDEHGRLLPARIAAVEILNLLRPTVAVSVYIVFLVHALNEHPEWRERITGDPAACEWFVQEVRRFYPFFPAVFARVRRRFEWHGYEFKRGRRVLLDITSTNHDPRAWEAPDEFRPDRFAHWAADPFTFIPQGGGDHCPGHRCAGEWLTIELMKASLRFLVERLRFDLTQQSLRIDRTRLPALPRDRIVLTHVRLIEPATAMPASEPAGETRRGQVAREIAAG